MINMIIVGVVMAVIGSLLMFFTNKGRMSEGYDGWEVMFSIGAILSVISVIGIPLLTFHIFYYIKFKKIYENREEINKIIDRYKEYDLFYKDYDLYLKKFNLLDKVIYKRIAKGYIKKKENKRMENLRQDEIRQSKIDIRNFFTDENLTMERRNDNIDEIIN